MNRIVLGTLRQRWLRTLLVGLSTLFAFTLLGFFFAIRHGFAVGPVQSGADLILIEPRGGSAPLPFSLLRTVRSFPGVRAAVGITGDTMRFGASPHPLAIEGLSPHAFLELSGLVKSGALASQQARHWQADRTGALVSAAAARKNDWRIGQTILLHPMPHSPPHDLQVHIDGIIGKNNGVNFSGDVNVHLGYFNRWSDTKIVAAVFAQARNARQASALAGAIQDRFSNSTSPVRTQTFQSLLQSVVERLADVNTITAVVITASLFGLFLICFNTVLHSVAERVGQFALLNAVGFAPPRLIWLVFLESFLTIVPAAALGLSCAWLAVHAIATEKLNLPGITLTAGGLADGVLIAMGLAVAAALLPSVQVLRLDCGRLLRRA